MSATLRKPRKPGAQPGNHNALKHGFYSRMFRAGEMMDLEAYVIDGLMDKIAMLRVWIRRVMAFGDGVDSLNEAIGVLGALGVASLQLASLLIFHTGHGEYGSDGSYYLVCHDSKIEDDKVASGSGVSQQELLEKMRAIPAERLLVIFNACHSGEISPAFGARETFGSKSLPGETAEALLATGSGRVVITACRENQVSYIGKGDLSIFTQALVDGLRGQGVTPRGGYISVFDLYAALFDRVSAVVWDMLGDKQEPELTVLKGVGPGGPDGGRGRHDRGRPHRHRRRGLRGIEPGRCEANSAEYCYKMMFRGSGGDSTIV